MKGRSITCPHCGEENVNFINGAICDFCGEDLFDDVEPEEDAEGEHGI
jgi:hypothetical protein